MTDELFIRLSLGVGGIKRNGSYHGILAVGSTLCGLLHGFVGHPKSNWEKKVVWPGILHKYRFVLTFLFPPLRFTDFDKT